MQKLKLSKNRSEQGGGLFTFSPQIRKKQEHSSKLSGLSSHPRNGQTTRMYQKKWGLKRQKKESKLSVSTWFAGWLSHRPLYGPASSCNSVAQILTCHTKRQLSRPLTQGLRFSFPRYNVVKSSIIRLFKPCGPLAVFWRVSTVVVSSLKSQSSFPCTPHIIIKILKVSPSFAYFYATSSVVRIIGIFRIITSLSDSDPCGINWLLKSLLVSYRKSVFRHSMPTSATYCGAFYKVVFCYFPTSTTLTSTQPHLLTPNKARKTYRSELTTLCSYKFVNLLLIYWHGEYRIS